MSAPFLQRFYDGWGAAALKMLYDCLLQSSVARRNCSHTIADRAFAIIESEASGLRY